MLLCLVSKEGGVRGRSRGPQGPGATDTILCNALLDMYAKCGVVTSAHLISDGIDEKNVVSWISIINAYASKGLGTEALKLFKKMKEEEFDGVRLNSVTFLSVRSACGHASLVEAGRGCFLSMRDKYGLDPGPEHYACYIDLLGHAGKREACDLFCSVDKLMGGVCEAMLNACKVSVNFVRGEIVARCFLELENSGIMS